MLKNSLLTRADVNVVICFVALNNAYQMIGTDYHIAYWSWVGMDVVFAIRAVVLAFKANSLK